MSHYSHLIKCDKLPLALNECSQKPISSSCCTKINQSVKDNKAFRYLIERKFKTFKKGILLHQQNILKNVFPLFLPLINKSYSLISCYL